MSTAYHPQSDGQTKVVNRCIEAYMRSMTLATNSNWLKWLSLAEWWYYSNYHTSLKMTPFQVLYGYPPPIFISYVPKDCPIEAMEQLLTERELMIQQLKHSLVVAQNRMKQIADRNRTEREFKDSGPNEPSRLYFQSSNSARE
ncbi:uncharacterized protein LOC143598350 [Bidens hawaiensis]|uniref:uncharacterized protein LOC143598350 n=1 Tax=Bidens hawaiensis TaxID=980011 RepID=UPI00404B8462